MKFHKLFLFLMLSTLLAAAVPAASADGGPVAGIWLSGSTQWLIPCNPISGGAVTAQVNINLPLNYWGEETDSLKSPTSTYSQTYSVPGNDYYSTAAYYGYLMIPPNGEARSTVKVYAPDGTVLTTAEFYGSCITGETYIKTSDFYGINEPAANQRVAATVLVDTPVYAIPGTVIPDLMLKAGQSWFVVGQTTDESGAVWYKVFVGGPTLAYVPASVLSLSGPVPSGYNGSSPDLPPFPTLPFAMG